MRLPTVIREAVEAQRPTTKLPRILLIDLERRAGQAFVFDQKIRGGFLPVSQWTSRPEMLCFAAKWHDRKRGEFYARWDHQDPHHLARESWRLVDAADWVVTYFGSRADIPWLRQAWLEAELPPPSPYKHIDLYYTGAKFGFESKSLGELSKKLGLGGKQGKYSPYDAEACMDGDLKARARMKKYNLGDVGPTSLEGCFDRLRPWIPGLNVGLYMDDDARVCPSCGHDGLEPAGFAVTDVTRYPAYRCRECKALCRGKNRAASVPMRGIRT